MKVITLILTVALFKGAVSDIDRRYIDESVDPCEDFYNYACGNFKNHHKKRDDQPLVDLFTITEDEMIKIGKEILSSPKRHRDAVALKKAKTAYTACVEVENETETYYQYPEKSVIDEIGMPFINGISLDKVSLVEVAEISVKFGLHHLFQFMVRNFDPERYIVMMYSDSFDQPEMIRPRAVKTYDEILEESFKKSSKPSLRILDEKDPLQTFFEDIASELNNMTGNYFPDKSKVESDLMQMREFMTSLFDGGIVDDNMIPLEDVVTLRQLQNWTQQQFGNEINVNWVDYFKVHFQKAKFNITEDFGVYLIGTESIYGVLNLIRQTDPNVVKNFVLFKTFLYMAPESSFGMRQAFGKYINASGLPYYNREDYCARRTLDIGESTSLSFAIANEFFKYHFDINKFPQAVQVLRNIKTAFEEVLGSYDWLDDESRDAVIAKLEQIVVFLAFPDFVENRSSLDHFYENVGICGWDNYGNAQRIRAFRKAYAFSQYVDHDAWLTSPFEVNAFAVRASNRIMTPLSMLHTSYFHGGKYEDYLYDYSRFGSIIAHEFIHHFDTSGTLYNETGFQSNLLSEKSAEAFKEKQQCLIDQYSSYYVPEVGAYINGSRTLNENMADVGGLKHAFAAFKKLIDGFSDEFKKKDMERDFFINFATTWCSIESTDYLQKLVKSDEHTPSRFRVIGTLSNMDEFSQAFSCLSNNTMNPEKKCQIW